MPRAKGGSIPPPVVYVHPGQGGLISILNDNDVLSGRGGRINNHPGNIAFRTIVEDYKHEYLDPRTRKLEKAHVAARLVAQVRAMNPPGRFLKEDSDNPGMYLEIGDQKAWKKAGQALREDAPEIRKEIDGENPDQFVPHPVHPYPPMQAPMPPLPGTFPPNGAPARGMDPPEAEGISGYRQPPLPYYDNRTPGPHSGRGSPHYHPQQPYPGRGYHPQHPHHYAPQPHMHQQYTQNQYQQAPYGTHPPPQRQPQFTGGPRNRFGAPMSSDRRGDFPSLAMSCATDFTMSDVSEFTPVSVTPRHERPVIPPPVVPVAYEPTLNVMKETTQPLEVAAVRQSSSDKSSLAVSELSVSGLKTSVMNIEPVSPQAEEPTRNQSNFSMSLGLSRNYSFPDLFLSTGDLGLDEEHTPVAENEKNNSDNTNGGAKHKKTKSGRLFRQSSAQRQGSLESSSSIFSIDSLKMGRGFHAARGRNNTDVSGLQDAMSLMSMDHQSIRSESSWLEAAKSMQSISSEMNPWGSHEGNSLRMNERDDGSIRSLSDMSNDLNALDLAELPLLPPIHHVESGLEDSVGFIQRPDP